ncbi:MAG: hypothetical protein K0R98_134 [Rickettsiaceae bacterium]|nr:hypothetical protein [Rickettsiaceae bacterium]
MGFLAFAAAVFVAGLIGLGIFSYKEREEKAAHAFFWSENLGPLKLATEIETELNDKYTEGTDIGEVLSVMLNNKAKCSKDTVVQPDKNNPASRTARYCSYTPEIYFLTTTKTVVSIFHTNNKIDSIKVMQKSVGF